MNITNKTVLITGANRGIGLALVDEALRRGAKKVYAGVRGALPHSDKRVTYLTLDVTNALQIKQAAGEVDTLDVLINNAGIAIYDDLSNSDVIGQHMAVNFFGMLNVTLACLRLLKRSKGAIINNLSMVALAPLPDHTRLLHFEGGRVFHDAVTASALGEPRRDGPCCRLGPHRYRYEPRLQHTEGLDRVRRTGHLRWARERRRRNFPRSRVPANSRGLAHRSSQGARAPVRGFRAAERGRRCRCGVGAALKRERSFR